MKPRIVVIFFLLIALVLACSLFGCEKNKSTWTVQSMDTTVRYFLLDSAMKVVSYKVEYKRHVAMIDSICAGKENCAGSLGFAEYFNQQDPSEPHRVKDLFHKDILITIP